MEPLNECSEPICQGNMLRRDISGRAVGYARGSVMCLGVVGVLLVGERGLAQTPPGDALRLTVRPHEMATGTKNTVAGLYPLDSIDHNWVYVPKQCVGPQRCPLLVYLLPESALNFQFPGANKYGIIVLSSNESTLDTALHHMFRTFAIDPNKIALAGFSREGYAALAVGHTNLDVFSRVAVLSAPQVDYDTAAGPRNTTAQFFVGKGIEGNEGLTVSRAFLRTQALRREGHPVRLVLSFRDHDHTTEEYASMWRWLHESWAAPRPGARATPPAVADSLPLLTAAVLTQWITFWTRFMVEPDSIRTTARLAHQKEFLVPFGQERPSVGMMDIPALSARYPSVAADLKAAGLTARQAEAYRLALFSARVVAREAHPVGGSRLSEFETIEPTSVLGKNAVFLEAHTEELEMLHAMGMWITP